MAKSVSPEACDKNSDASLDALIGLAVSYAGYTERDARPLVEYVGRLRDSDWKRRLDGSPKSWERFCREQLGYDAAYFREIGAGVKVLEEMGRKNPTIGESLTASDRAKNPKTLLSNRGPATEEEKANVGVTNISRGGTTADYLTARIARDHPAILDRMKAGEFKSVRAAAIEAGIVKVPTALDIMRRAGARASSKELKQFIEDIPLTASVLFWAAWHRATKEERGDFMDEAAKLGW